MGRGIQRSTLVCCWRNRKSSGVRDLSPFCDFTYWAENTPNTLLFLLNSDKELSTLAVWNELIELPGLLLWLPAGQRVPSRKATVVGTLLLSLSNSEIT